LKILSLAQVAQKYVITMKSWQGESFATENMKMEIKPV
jgi:hypothetical protein